MANMNTTANPLGRWWHPLPLTSGIGAMLGMVIMKWAGMLDWAWWAVIVFPIVADLIVNFLMVAVGAFGCWISDVIEKRNRRRKSD